MEEIRKYLENIGKNYRKRRLKENKEYYDALMNYYDGVTTNLSEIMYLFMNNMDKPRCVVCGNYVKWLGHGKYKKTCSHSCRAKNIDYENRTKKTEKTLEEKYGVRNALQLVDRKKSSPKSDKWYESQKNIDFRARQQKYTDTVRERYGVENVSQLPDVRTKVINTNLKRYGVTHYVKSDEYQDKMRLKQLDNIRERYSQLKGEILDITKGHTNHIYSIYRVHYFCPECSDEILIPLETFKWRYSRFNDVCRECIGLEYNRSTAEKEIYEFVLTIDDTAISNYSLPSGKELDIFSPKFGIAIEYNGLYWHSVANGKDKTYHIDKTIECEENSISLIHVFEDEWIQKPEIVKSIIEAKAGKFKKRIYARKTLIQELSVKEARNFLDNTHIMGYNKNRCKLGLYYGDELVSVMTFSRGNHSRKSKGWEIDRYATLQGYQVVGGAGKLFAEFLRLYHPDEVTSYADRRYGNGEVYGKIGFEFIKFTAPNYWYVKSENRVHRFALRKNYKEGVDDPSKTEWENRQEQGWNRIWDCGHAKWVWRK